jgi:hypothetical protein
MFGGRLNPARELFNDGFNYIKDDNYGLTKAAITKMMNTSFKDRGFSHVVYYTRNEPIGLYTEVYAK